ncbi:MAG: hypothetical protein ACQEXB_07640 [Bacillota bacterium]
MDMNLLEVEYMMHARKAKAEESMSVGEIYNLHKNEKRKNYCVRVFGFEVCI